MSKCLDVRKMYFTFVKNSLLMEDQIILRLDDGLEMVVTFELCGAEPATDISPPYPATIHILSVKLWQKGYQSYDCVDITCADDCLLDWNQERIEQAIWKHLEDEEL